jgi:hypothetical protein
VPAARETVSPLAQDASAELIWATVADEVRLAQFVVRAGMPPTPDLDQSIAALLLNMGDHTWAWLYSENTNKNMESVVMQRLIGPHLWPLPSTL